ncbi:yemanuclein isoform X2 [Zophobas morio]|uniref:yemanuclein isoform X2 n=1 Tax=Zophobas morio TaxID=2755281 RepID=UPI0030830163
MSEIKRAQLIPLGSQKESDKSSKEPRKTIRISVVLPESTEDTCPEYNYKDELAGAKKLGRYKETGGGALNGLNRVDEFADDDDVKRIARQMEEKYGTGTSLNKKKRKGKKDDYADIGMGYDESDSFIDNTDGYDEMIPQNVTTLHGGFYINSGALEFKTDDEADSDLSSSSSEDDENSPKTTSRKRVIESSDETDRENKTETVDNANNFEKKRKLQNGGNGMQQSLKKKLLGQNKIYIKKRRLLDPQKKTVKELLREKREDLNMSVPEELNNSTVNEEGKEKKTMSISSVTDVIESVVKASTEDSKPVESSTTKVVVHSSSDGESSHDNATNATKIEVKLPENLSGDILSVITAIKNAAEHSNLDGKNSFTSEINLLILRLERKSKCLGKPSKMKVYEHLSVLLKCKTETLIRRAKTLVLDDEQKKLKSLLSGLQSEINKIMPSLLESYEKESQRILQKKFSQESVENEENKCLRMPKRRFQWNDVTKKQLKDILMLKKRCLLLEGKSKDVLDTQMTTFLKTEIQVLWPEGWMSMNALNKIYTMYADPKRILSNGSTTAAPVTSQPKSATSTSTTTTTVKNLPQSFNNSNLSITPIVAAAKSDSNSNKVHSVTNEVSVSKTCNETSINLSLKSLPETSQPCDISPASPKKEVEVKLKVKSPSELLKPPVSNHVNKKDSPISLISDDSVIILDGTARNDRFSPNKDKFHAKSDDNYCQVIDLSDKNDFKVKPEQKTHPKREKTISPMMPEQMSHVAKHHDLSITPSYPKVEPPKSKASDDIQKVMENLKNLQKMSSPKKCVDPSPTSSAVSVIAVNKSFAPKSVHSESSSTMQRYDYNKTEYNTSFQDEFQKQLFSCLNHYQQGSNKNYNSRYPHISSGSTVGSGDKYFQNSNNNYTQNSNGHKSSTSAQQSGTYNILDDMLFANILTQYGLSKEAAAPNLNRNS